MLHPAFHSAAKGMAALFCAALMALAAPAAGEPFLKSWVPQRFLESPEPIATTALSPDGKALAVLLRGGSIRVFDLVGKRTLHVVPRVAAGTTCMSLGPDGGMLAFAAGRAVYVCDVAGHAGPRLIHTAGSAIYRLALFPALDLLALASPEGVRVLNARTGEALFSSLDTPCLNAGFSPDAQVLAVLQGKSVLAYDLPNLTLRWKSALNFFPSALSFSQDGAMLAVAGDSGNIGLLALGDGRVVQKVGLGLSVSRIQHLALTPDGSGLVAGTDRRLFVLEDAAATEPRRREIKLDDRITSLALSGMAQSLLVSCEDARYLQAFSTSLRLPEGLFKDYKPKPAIRIVQPQVTILAPPPDTLVQGGAVAVLARIKADPEQQLEALKVLVDGRAVEIAGTGPRTATLPDGAPPLEADEELRAFTVPIPGRDCTVALIGETRYATSQMAVLKVRREAPPEPRPELRIVQPELEILSPAPETTVRGEAVPFLVRVKAAKDQPCQSVQIMVDGRAVEAVGGPSPRQAARALGIEVRPGAGDLFLFSVPLPARDCTLAAYAQTRFASSDPASVRLRREPPPPASPPPPVMAIVRPTAAIVSPRDGALAKEDAVQLTVKVSSSPEQKITGLKVMVDGQSVALLADTAGTAGRPGPGGLVEEERLVRVPIPARPCTIAVWAETAYANSELATLRVRREEQPLPPPAPATRPEPPPIVQPKVAIVSPPNGTVVQEASFPLRIRVDYATAQKVTGIRVLVDGVALASANLRGLRPWQDPGSAPQPAAAHPAAGLAAEYQDFQVPIPPRDCTVAVLAETALANSELATVKLHYQEKPRLDTGSLPRLYLLAVGVADYQDPGLKLSYPAKDARDFSKLLEAQKGRLYREVSATLLTDAKATRDNILDGLEWLQRQVTQKDVAVLFFAGHGMNDPTTGSFYFLPVNADLDAVRRTMLASTDITSTLDSLAGKRVLFLDACNSASVRGRGGIRGGIDLARIRKEFEAAGEGSVVFAAASGRQGAQESEEWGNGAFTKALLEGMGARGDPHRTGRITVSMLNTYITERVKELTRGAQTPIFKSQDDLADFPLALLDLAP